MARPVVHCEIIGRQPEKLRRYYRELLEWGFDMSVPASPSAFATSDDTRPAESGRLGARTVAVIVDPPAETAGVLPIVEELAHRR
jgi:predicted enzyme related to lactoylglutathione lyase